MYLVPLKSATPLRNANLKPENFSYPALIKTALNMPPDGGFTMQEMRARNRVLDALELVQSEFAVKGQAEITLEDSDFEKLKECINNCRWGVVENIIIQLSDDINALTKQP